LFFYCSSTRVIMALFIVFALHLMVSHTVVEQTMPPSVCGVGKGKKWVLRILKRARCNTHCWSWDTQSILKKFSDFREWNEKLYSSNVKTFRCWLCIWGVGKYTRIIDLWTSLSQAITTS
jgi:hypothetical protein